MNTKLIKFGKFALASLSVAVLTNSIAPVVTAPPEAIALPATSIAVNNQNLVGTWRATDESIREYHEKLVEGPAPVKHISGDYLYIFDNNGKMRLVMKDVTMGGDMPTPMVMNGSGLSSWQASNGNTLNFEPIESFSGKAEVMGMEIPLMKGMVPKVHTTLNYKLEGNTLRLTNVPGGHYFDLTLERL